MIIGCTLTVLTFVPNIMDIYSRGFFLGYGICMIFWGLREMRIEEAMDKIKETTKLKTINKKMENIDKVEKVNNAKG